MQPCHHESQPAPSSTPTHSVLLVRASQLSQTTPSSPWIYFGFHNHAIWKNGYRTQEDCEASLNCFLDYLREPAADGGRKIHDLNWANAYAKCNGVWPRTVSHGASVASYPYGDDSGRSASMWPHTGARMSLTVPVQSCDFPCRVNTQTISLEYVGFTIHNPATARGAPPNLFEWGYKPSDWASPTADVLVGGVLITISILVGVCGLLALIARRCKDKKSLPPYVPLPKRLRGVRASIGETTASPLSSSTEMAQPRPTTTSSSTELQPQDDNDERRAHV